MRLVTRDTAYAWQVSACRDRAVLDCTPYSQLWKFSTTAWDIEIDRRNPLSDTEKPIGLPVNVAWISTYGNSFKYKIYEGEVATCGAAPLLEDWTTEFDITLEYKGADTLEILELDKVYSWCVQPCRDFNITDCDDWGGPWYFRTTGRPPEIDTMKPDSENITTPSEFTWEKIPGAESYWFKIDDKEPILIPAKKAKIELSYPDLKPETTYSWKIQTCADKDGEICGVYSNAQTFTTFKWAEEVPSPKPADDTEVSDTDISWGKVEGAKYYKYKVTFVELDGEEPREECKDEVDKVTDEDITAQRSVDLSLGLKCWGEYEWSITACLDADCEEMGPEAIWHFYFKTPSLPPDESPGLIPCNQPYDNRNTIWNETDPCEIKHLFILLNTIVEFLFIRVVPMILVLLVLASGVIIYFSRKMEAPSPMAKVKFIWKATGIGIGLLLFAWLITSLLLNVFGYQVGPWNILG